MFAVYNGFPRDIINRRGLKKNKQHNSPNSVFETDLSSCKFVLFLPQSNVDSDDVINRRTTWVLAGAEKIKIS